MSKKLRGTEKRGIVQEIINFLNLQKRIYTLRIVVVYLEMSRKKSYDNDSNICKVDKTFPPEKEKLKYERYFYD